MGDEERKISYSLEAKLDGLLAALKTGQDSTKSAADTMLGSFNALGGGINKVIGITGTLGGILAGGAMFKDIISTTNAVTGEVTRLSKGLGITAQQASVLRIALDDAFLSVDDIMAGSNRLTKQLLTNEDAFRKLGVETRDGNGHYRDTVSIMMDVNDKLRGMKEGTDQNVAGMSVYGKSWGEVRGLLKLNAESMKEAKQRAEDLHLIIGPDGIAQSKAYKLAVKDLQDVNESFKVQIGRELIPALTNLGIVFGEAGVKAAGFFAKVIRGGNQDLSFAGAWTRRQLGRIPQDKELNNWKEYEARQQAEDQMYMRRLERESGKNGGLTTDINRAIQPAPQKGNQLDPDQMAKDAAAKQMAAIEARLKASIAGYKAEESAAKDHQQNLLALEDFYLKTGLENEEEYRQNKYEIDRKGFQEAQGILDKEIAAIETATAKKLKAAKGKDERAKITAESQAEIAGKVAERQKLDSEIYRLDIAYQAQTIAEENATFKAYMDRVFELRQKEKDLVLAGVREVAAARSKEIDEATAAEERMANEIVASSNETRKLLLQNQMPGGSGNSMALIENEYQLRREMLRNQYAQDLADAERFRLDKKMAEVAYANGIVQLETDTALKRKAIEEQVNQQKWQMQSNMVNAAVGLLNVFAGKSRIAAIAALTLEKGLSIANTYMATQTASMLAYGSQFVVGDPTSVVRAEAARDYTLGIGYATMALIGATGIAQAAMSGGGGGSYGGGTPSSPVVTQPTSAAQPQTPTNVTVQVMGHIIGEDSWVQNNLIPALNGALGRNVTLNLGGV